MRSKSETVGETGDENHMVSLENQETNKETNLTTETLNHLIGDNDVAARELAKLLQSTDSYRFEDDEKKGMLKARSGASKKHNRLSMLTKVVERNGPLHLKKAAAILDVSEMTVRRDIASCDGKLGYLGGYIVAGMRNTMLPKYTTKKDDDQHIAHKEAACALAASLIEEDDILFMDCGTTLPYLAQSIPDDKRLTVVCYALNIADILCSKPKTRVVLLGGLFHSVSATFASDEAMRTLNKLRITKAFFSAGGIHPTQGVSCSHFHEVTIKQAVINNAMKKYVVVDSSKFNRVKLAHFADLTSFDAVITDQGISVEDQIAVEAKGVAVMKG